MANIDKTGNTQANINMNNKNTNTNTNTNTSKHPRNDTPNNVNE